MKWLWTNCLYWVLLTVPGETTTVPEFTTSTKGSTTVSVSTTSPTVTEVTTTVQTSPTTGTTQTQTLVVTQPPTSVESTTTGTSTFQIKTKHMHILICCRSSWDDVIWMNDSILEELRFWYFQCNFFVFHWKLKKYDFVGVKSWFFTWNTPKISRAPPKIEKIWFFWCKIVIFHTKYPKYFRASLRSAQFF